MNNSNNHLRNIWLLSIVVYLILRFVISNPSWALVLYIPFIVGTLSFVSWLIVTLVNKSLKFSEKVKAIFVGISIAFAMLVANWVIDGTYISKIQVGNSSIKELKSGWGYFVCRQCKDLNRGDIVVYQTSQFPDQYSGDVVGRVIGLPNEKIEISDNAVHISGEQLDETSYANWDNWKRKDPLIVNLKDNQYFALWDKRSSFGDESLYRHRFSPNELIGKIMY